MRNVDIDWGQINTCFVGYIEAQILRNIIVAKWRKQAESIRGNSALNHRKFPSFSFFQFPSEELCYDVDQLWSISQMVSGNRYYSSSYLTSSL